MRIESRKSRSVKSLFSKTSPKSYNVRLVQVGPKTFRVKWALGLTGPFKDGNGAYFTWKDRSIKPFVGAKIVAPEAHWKS